MADHTGGSNLQYKVISLTPVITILVVHYVVLAITFVLIHKNVKIKKVLSDFLGEHI